MESGKKALSLSTKKRTRYETQGLDDSSPPTKSFVTSSMIAPRSLPHKDSGAVIPKVTIPHLSSIVDNSFHFSQLAGAEQFLPTFVEATKVVRRKDVEDMEGHTLADLMNIMQFISFQLGCMTTHYKERISKYDSKMKANIKTWRKRFEDAKNQIKVDTVMFEGELQNLRLYLTNQVLISEQQVKDSDFQFQEMINKLTNQIEALEKKADGSYNSCILSIVMIALWLFLGEAIPR